MARRIRLAEILYHRVVEIKMHVIKPLRNQTTSMWLKLAEAIEAKIAASKPIGDESLRRYWARRHFDPLIQMKWDAATRVDPVGRNRQGTIYFPNNTTRKFNGVKIHD